MKNRKPNHQAQIYAMFAGKSIAYHPGLAIVTGSVNAALLFSQLLYWQGKGHKGEWTYKTCQEIKNETGLSRANQDTVIKRCTSLQLLETKLAGVPATKHFRINIKKLIEAIISLQESGKLETLQSPNSDAGKPQTITENTAESITESNPTGLERLEKMKTKYEFLNENKNDFIKKNFGNIRF